MFHEFTWQAKRSTGVLKFAAVMLTFAVGQLYCHEWHSIIPRVESEVNGLPLSDAQALLSEFCKSRIENKNGIGLTCSTRSLGPEFADIVDEAFHPQGVIRGHFLGTQSDDATVSGWSAETHPYLWGGTLLLTKRDGKWVPIWYKSAVITHSCHKIGLPNGREILLCEEEDGGMGHELHYLYSVDFTHPLDVRKTTLVTTDSFHYPCNTLLQEISRVEWMQATHHLVVTVRTPEWQHSSSDSCAGDRTPAKRPPIVLTYTLQVTNAGFRAF